jgi:hypothetical protein
MAEKILVALRKNDLAEEVLPYVQQLARPGMKVVFIIPDQADGFEYLLRHKGTMETGLHSAFAARENAKRYIAESRRNSATQKIFPASKELRKQGVELAADFYSGSLASALKSYYSSGNAHLTMIPARSRALLEVLCLLFRILKRPTPASILLLRPAMGNSK